MVVNESIVFCEHNKVNESIVFCYGESEEEEDFESNFVNSFCCDNVSLGRDFFFFFFAVGNDDSNLVASDI